MSSIKSVFIILIIAATLLLTACPFPVPPRSLGTRGNIDDNMPAFIKEGVTTREDVFMNLGEPDAVAIDDSWVMYVNGRGRGGLGFIMAAGSAAAGFMMEATHYRRLIIKFDTSGIVIFKITETKNCALFSGGGGNNASQSRPCLDVMGTDIPDKYNWPELRSSGY